MKLVLLCLLLAAAPAPTYPDIDIGHADKACAEECTTTYSGCISNGPSSRLQDRDDKPARLR